MGTPKTPFIVTSDIWVRLEEVKREKAVPVLFVKEIFCLATSPSTLTSELMSRTWAGGLEPGSHQWNSSHRVGLGVRGQAWTPPGAPGRPCVQSIFQCPHWPQVRQALVGSHGFGHAFIQLVASERGSRRGLKPRSGRVLATLILFLLMLPKRNT